MSIPSNYPNPTYLAPIKLASGLLALVLVAILDSILEARFIGLDPIAELL